MLWLVPSSVVFALYCVLFTAVASMAHPEQAADVCLLQYTLGRTMEQGISLHFLFAFESAVASSTCLVTFIKYCM